MSVKQRLDIRPKGTHAAVRTRTHVLRMFASPHARAHLFEILSLYYSNYQKAGAERCCRGINYSRDAHWFPFTAAV